MGRWLLEKPTKPGPRLLVVLELQEGEQFLPDQSLIQPTVLPERDPFDVDPILGTAREGLEYDEVFGAARQHSGRKPGESSSSRESPR